MHDIASGHRVLIVGHPGAHGMELLGVRDMFEMASHLCGDSGAGLRGLAVDGKSLRGAANAVPITPITMDIGALSRRAHGRPGKRTASSAHAYTKS
ncbi:hypothetical protein ACWGQ5_47780 [Streptomyces sp. NPDC055722]